MDDKEIKKLKEMFTGLSSEIATVVVGGLGHQKEHDGGIVFGVIHSALCVNLAAMCNFSSVDRETFADYCREHILDTLKTMELAARERHSVGVPVNAAEYAERALKEILKNRGI